MACVKVSKGGKFKDGSSKGKGVIRVIDPNCFDPSNTGGGVESPTVNPEDLDIFVSLQAKTKGKSVLFHEDKSESIDGVSFDFLTPRKKGGEKKPFLTSDWTEIGGLFNDTSLGEDNEGFGITNIEIDINASHIPKVVIDFTDIRGATLFEQGSCSKYKVFFHLPYPIFELTVKGYYGEPVKWYLNLVKFNTKFNSETGNFESRGEFIGWSYAFLADMLMGYGLAAPYMEKHNAKNLLLKCFENTQKYYKQLFGEGSEEYQNFLNTTTLENDPSPLGGETMFCPNNNCLTIIQLLQKIKNLEKQIGVIGKSSDIEKLRDLNNIKDNLRNLQTTTKEFGKKLKPFGFSDDGGEKYTYVNKNNVELTNNAKFLELVNSYWGTSGRIPNRVKMIKQLVNDTSLVDIKLFTTSKDGENPLDILKTKKLAFQKNVTSKADNGYHNPNEPPNGIIGLTLVTVDPGLSGLPNTSNAPTKTNIEGYVNLGILILEIDDEIKKINEEIKSEKESVSVEINRIIKEALGFSPTIRNIFIILSCNIELFNMILLETTISAEGYHNEKYNPEDSNGNKKFDDSGDLDSEDLLPNLDFVWPWPTYKKIKKGSKDNGKTDNHVEVYPGEDHDDWKEVEFVEDFVDAMLRLKKDIEALSDDKSGIAGFDNYAPINPLETPLSDNNLPLKYRGIDENTDGIGGLWKVIGERALIGLDYTHFNPIYLSKDSLTIPSYVNAIIGKANAKEAGFSPLSANGDEVSAALGFLEAYNLVNSIENTDTLMVISSSVDNLQTLVINDLKLNNKGAKFKDVKFTDIRGGTTTDFSPNFTRVTGIDDNTTFYTYEPKDGFIYLGAENHSEIKIYSNPYNKNVTAKDIFQIHDSEVLTNGDVREIKITNEKFKEALKKYTDDINNVLLRNDTTKKIIDTNGSDGKVGLHGSQKTFYYNEDRIFIALKPGTKTPSATEKYLPSSNDDFLNIDDEDLLYVNYMETNNTGIDPESFNVTKNTINSSTSTALIKGIKTFSDIYVGTFKSVYKGVTNFKFGSALEKLFVGNIAAQVATVNSTSSSLDYWSYGGPPIDFFENNDINAKKLPNYYPSTSKPGAVTNDKEGYLIDLEDGNDLVCSTLIQLPIWLDNVNEARKMLSGSTLDTFGLKNNSKDKKDYTSNDIQNRNLAYLFLDNLLPSPLISQAQNKEGGVSGGFLKSIIPFNTMGALVDVPKAWLLAFGSKLWRYKNFVGTTTDGKWNKVSENEHFKSEDSGYDTLSQPGYPIRREIKTPVGKNEVSAHKLLSIDKSSSKEGAAYYGAAYALSVGGAAGFLPLAVLGAGALALYNFVTTDFGDDRVRKTTTKYLRENVFSGNTKISGNNFQKSAFNNNILDKDYERSIFGKGFDVGDIKGSYFDYYNFYSSYNTSNNNNKYITDSGEPVKGFDLTIMTATTVSDGSTTGTTLRVDYVPFVLGLCKYNGTTPSRENMVNGIKRGGNVFADNAYWPFKWTAPWDWGFYLEPQSTVADFYFEELPKPEDLQTQYQTFPNYNLGEAYEYIGFLPKSYQHRDLKDNSITGVKNAVSTGSLGWVMERIPDIVKDVIIEKFESWVDTEFKDELLPQIDPVNFKLDKVELNDDYEISNTTQIGGFNDSATRLTPKSSLADKIKSLINEKYTIVNSTPKIWWAIKEDDIEKTYRDSFIVKTEHLDGYLTSMAITLKRIIGERIKELEKEESDEKNDSLLDDDDMKLSLYRSFKSLNDKWISSTEKHGNDYRMYFNIQDDKCIKSRDGIERDKLPLASHFSFVNRVMGDIGDKAVLDIRELNTVVENPTMSFYQLIDRIMKENQFNFFPLPSFSNFTNSNIFPTDGNQTALDASLGRMFEPVTSWNCIESGPAFICMYAGGSSSVLDYGASGANCGIDKAEIKALNDGITKFLDEDGNITPEAILSDLGDEDANMTMFKVAYGQENQNHFKSIQLDQAEFTETQESLMIIDQLAKGGGDPSKKTSKGQNLHNLYLTRSYKSTIESMGNMMIQPMMYYQLDNIPMFSGMYMILSVKHSVNSNNVSTTFTGVRQPIVTIPMVTDMVTAMNLDLGDLTSGLDDDEIGSGGSLSSQGGTTSTSSNGGTTQVQGNGGPSNITSTPISTKSVAGITVLEGKKYKSAGVLNTKNVSTIVLHWTAGFSFHVDTSTSVGYQFTIDSDGGLWETNNVLNKSSHAGCPSSKRFGCHSMNSKSVGISYVGGIKFHQKLGINGEVDGIHNFPGNKETNTTRGYALTEKEWGLDELYLPFGSLIKVGGRWVPNPKHIPKTIKINPKKQWDSIVNAILLAKSAHPTITNITSHHWTSADKQDVRDEFPWGKLIGDLKAKGFSEVRIVKDWPDTNGPGKTGKNVYQGNVILPENLFGPEAEEKQGNE